MACERVAASGRDQTPARDTEAPRATPGTRGAGARPRPVEPRTDQTPARSTEATRARPGNGTEGFGASSIEEKYEEAKRSVLMRRTPRKVYTHLTSLLYSVHLHLTEKQGHTPRARTP